MSVPAPPVALANQVSALYANTLYTFQPDAFQSISLAKNSQWESLTMGVSVNGSQAVVAQSAGDDCLFIVGGRSNASEQSFPGFQKYDLKTKIWQALAPETSVAQNRVQHGAAYLSSTKSILLYGGSQDNSYTASTQTYTIGTDEPYVMKSYPPGAPAVQNPILLPYNASHALMAGGGASNEQIWLFSESDGWHMMTTTVPGGVADASKVQAALTTDTSGNKQLQLFDMSSSPNKVTNVALSNQFHKREDTPIVERDNSAPTASRSGFSLAQDGNLVVISGGTGDKTAGSVAVFDGSKSGWQDPSSIFGAQQASTGGTVAANGLSASDPNLKGGNSAPSSAPASNDAPASSAAAASSGSPSSGAPASSGAASASQPAPSGASASSAASGASSAASSAASGASSGAASATDSAGSTATGSSAAAASSAAEASKTSGGASSSAAAAAAAASTSADAGGAGQSSTSVILAAVLGSFFGIAAIFLIALLLVRYRRNKAKEQQQRQDALDEKRAGSPASSIGSINAPGYGGRNRSPFENGQTPQISRPTLEPQTQAEDLAPPRKLGNDDEWGRYFNNNNTVENLYPGAAGQPQEVNRLSTNSHSHLAGAAIGGAAIGAAAAAGFAAANHARNTQYTIGSEYTIDSPTSSTAPGNHESALVPPLNLRTSSHGQLDHARPFSDDSSNNRDTFLESSSGQGSWDPTSSEHDSTSSAGFGGSYGHARPASSVYYDRASSIYPPTLSPTAMENFPPVPAIKQGLGGDADKGMRSIMSTDFGAGPTNGQTYPEGSTRRVAPGTEPRSAGSGTGHTEKDLSWLQIGSAN